MGFYYFMRILGFGCTGLYALLAYVAGLRHNTFRLAEMCLIAALYCYAGCKSHSGVKRERRKRWNR